jgi:hypothetical protein
MNRQQVIETGARPDLVLQEVSGHLTVRGWDRGEVQVRAEEDSLSLEGGTESVAIRCEGDCKIHAPFGASLTLEQVAGDADITGIHGAINVHRVEGHLRLRDAGPTVIEEVEGDVQIRQIAGSVRADQISGHLQIESVYSNEAQDEGDEAVDEAARGQARIAPGGAVHVDSVSGNVHLRNTGAVTIDNVDGNFEAFQIDGDILIDNVGGNSTVDGTVGRLKIENTGGNLNVTRIAGSVQAHAGGNARLQLAMPPDAEHRINAGGNLSCRIPPDASVRVHLSSDAKLSVAHLPVTQNLSRRGNGEFTLGAGNASLELRAGGHLSLSGDVGPEPGVHHHQGEYTVNIDLDVVREMAERASEATQQVVEQMEQQMEALARQLDERLAHLGSSDEIAARVQQKVQAAIRRAEEKVTEAMRDTERRVREAERQAAKWESKRRKHAFVWPAPPVPPVPPVRPARPPQPAPVTDQERMLILRMLEEGKINVEQAEKLLAALQGQG